MCCMHVFDGLWQRSHFSSSLSLNAFMIVRSMINYLLRVYFCHYFFACECIVVVRTVQHEEPLDWQISIRKHNGSKVRTRIGNRNCSTGTEVFNFELNYETFRVRRVPVPRVESTYFIERGPWRGEQQRDHQFWIDKRFFVLLLKHGTRYSYFTQYNMFISFGFRTWSSISSLKRQSLNSACW